MGATQRMNRRKSLPPWWQLPALITGGVAAAGVLTTGIVKAASVITLPSRLEAAERQNALQDDAILELKKTSEIWTQIYQQQQAAKTTRAWNSEAGKWMCCDEAPAVCDQAASWYWCD